MKKDIKFEEALEKLEEQVRLLESGDVSLDDSLLAFEKAVGLVKICNEKLENAEQKVRILTESIDGTVSDAPFDIDDEA